MWKQLTILLLQIIDISSKPKKDDGASKSQDKKEIWDAQTQP